MTTKTQIHSQSPLWWRAFNNSPVFSSDVAFSSGGTITTSTTTTYSYAGTNYANPHAVTQITPASSGQATTTFVYDNNGNLTQSGTTTASTTYAWDYRNRLTGSATSTVSGTTTYAYDHADQRVRKSDKSATTTYIGKFYDTTSTKGITAASTTAYIWVADTLVATVEANGTATTTYFIHPDHLGSTNVITNAIGTVKQVLDYKPFGEERINSNANLARRTFIDQFYDREQSLSYLNARYYQNSRGQFLSEDPSFFIINERSRDLIDPQSQNSYAYARNNPIINYDTNRESLRTAGQGFISPFVYAYEHPYQTAGIVAVTTAATIFAPVTVAVVGAALGGYAIGSAGYNAYSATNADLRDYYIGQGFSATLFTGFGIKQNGVALGNPCIAFCGTVGQQSAAYAQSLNIMASNRTLKNLVNNTYQASDRMSGGTFGALRNEIVTGQPTGNSFHYEKTINTLNGIKNVLSSGNVTSGDLRDIQTLLNNLAKEVVAATQQVAKK